MEQKLEKKLMPSQVEINRWYCLLDTFDEKYILYINAKKDDFIVFTYRDGTQGMIQTWAKAFYFYEIPLSPLEQELL